MLLQQVFWLTYLVYFCVFFLSAGGARVNVTVDDAEIDNGVSRITYSDPTTWKEGNGCTSCAAHPSTDNVFDKTWHDTSFPTNGTYGDLRNASLVFNGSAIYVYCIISHSLDNPFGNSDMTFYIDDEVVGNYALYPNGDPTYDFNVPVYTNDSISPGVHSFRLQGGSIGGQWSIVLLDYIVYT
ncbi:hypothetical protein BDY19DRAFT_888760 [Irpex rosettiformis]|uniref:Uncharacterized protein n=1 Tax=Irpex rosettiformis TaxID=378272 RepID=A0ACB8U6Q5_9APHY|nr:hypothetical protein BDY19DRAFT_888760 [Irpex rosettiformis]